MLPPGSTTGSWSAGPSEVLDTDVEVSYVVQDFCWLFSKIPRNSGPESGWKKACPNCTEVFFLLQEVEKLTFPRSRSRSSRLD